MKLDILAPFSPPETNFLDRLRYWTLAQPEKTAYRFLRDGETDEVTLSYAELDMRARAIAATLVSMGLRHKRALMMYPPGLEFIEALYGCYYANVIPVPAYPPRRNRNMGRINGISEDCRASAALTVSEVRDRSGGLLDDAPSLSSVPWICTDQVPTEMCSDWTQPRVEASDIGLIQYTSGSTGTPKGVVLTHGNLMSNCRMITESFQLPPVGQGMTWLPVYHDMGLIGGILNPMFAGCTNTLMSPVSFLTRPIRWLRAISSFGITCSGGPNFAYALCVEKISHDQCQGLDLSTWDLAFNGAEPVRARTLREFSQKFARYGFRHEAHYPCYGMAEAALIISGGHKLQPPVVRSFDRHELASFRVRRVDEDSSKSQDLVGNGRVLPAEDLIAVNPDTRQILAEGQIGEIWVSSPSVGQGYLDKPEESAYTFGATTANDPHRTWLRTGDLGFFDEGELFITGRLKDMIIVRGVNRYPQDIEATVESANVRLRSGGAAAFAVEHWDREQLVIVCEVERGPNVELTGLTQVVRQAVAAEHEIMVDVVVLVRANSVPKTSSGKVQRRACRENYLQNKLLVVDRWSATDPVASSPVPVQAPAPPPVGDIDPGVIEAVMRFVREIARERARDLTPDSNIVVDLGLDSLERLRIASEIESAFGGRIPDEVLQEVETVREVAAAVQQHIGTRLVNGHSPAEPPVLSSGRITEAEEIPESHYLLEQTPEFLRLQRQQEQIVSSGLRNPFFSVHEGVICDTTRIDGRELISFSSYNYLGLSGHPEVTEGAIDSIRRFGTSVSASRLVSGEKTIHRELEQGLAGFLGVEDAITFPGGHATNESVIGHLVGKGDLILHDALAHNSIIQGAELSGARRRPFEHNDWRHLNAILREIRRDYRRVLIAIEGLYSMDGDFPDLPKFVEVKQRHRCWLFVDEAHSIGTLGATGRGVGELYSIPRGDVECWMGTLSKSFGSCGGFIGGTRQMVDYLRYTTPGFVFAAGIPPGNVGAALAALRVMQREPERVARLAENSRLFLGLARAAGLNTGPSHDSPIIPVITGSSEAALRLSEGLFRAGINAQPIIHPAVAEDQTRVRFFVSAAHHDRQIRTAVQVISDVWASITGVAA